MSIDIESEPDIYPSGHERPPDVDGVEVGAEGLVGRIDGVLLAIVGDIFAAEVEVGSSHFMGDLRHQLCVGGRVEGVGDGCLGYSCGAVELDGGVEYPSSKACGI